jgi:hypothetical protein
MAAGGKRAREHGVEKKSVFTVHIFPQAIPARVRGSRAAATAATAKVAKCCSCNNKEHANTPMKKDAIWDSMSTRIASPRRWREAGRQGEVRDTGTPSNDL